MVLFSIIADRDGLHTVLDFLNLFSLCRSSISVFLLSFFILTTFGLFDLLFVYIFLFELIHRYFVSVCHDCYQFNHSCVNLALRLRQHSLYCVDLQQK